MPEPDPADDRFLTALTTDQFVLQSARATVSAEATSRAAVYLAAVSASLIALGFTVGHSFFPYFLGAVLPVLAVLGLLTYLRLVQIAAEDIAHYVQIERIRQYYSELHPRAPDFFPSAVNAVPPTQPGGRLQFLSRQGWLTAASVIGVVNSMLIGAGVGLATVAAFGWPAGVATVIAVVVAAGLAVAHVRVQRRSLPAV